MTFEHGGPSFGVRDGLLGTWDGDGTYSDQVDIFGIRVFSAALETTSQDLDGDDTTLATAVTIKKGTITLAFASIQFNLFEILTGVPQVDSGTLTRQRVTSKQPPYVGIVGKAMSVEGGGDLHLFVPKAKMTGGFEVRLELDTFSIPSITLSAVADDNFVDAENYPLIWDMDQHATATAPVLPPTGMLT